MSQGFTEITIPNKRSVTPQNEDAWKGAQAKTELLERISVAAGRHKKVLRRTHIAMGVTIDQQATLRLIYTTDALKRYSLAVIGECIANPNMGIRILPVGSEGIVKQMAHVLILEMGLDEYFMAEREYLLYDPKIKPTVAPKPEPEQVDISPPV